MKQGLFTNADVRPLDIEVKRLFGDTMEISASGNVVPVEIEQRTHGDEELNVEKKTGFQYNLYITTVNISGYEELVAALVELKYTHGDEISLMRKGMINAKDDEYIEYVNYVETCKTAAKDFYHIN